MQSAAFQEIQGVSAKSSYTKWGYVQTAVSQWGPHVAYPLSYNFRDCQGPRNYFQIGLRRLQIAAGSGCFAERYVSAARSSCLGNHHIFNKNIPFHPQRSIWEIFQQGLSSLLSRKKTRSLSKTLGSHYTKQDQYISFICILSGIYLSTMLPTGMTIHDCDVCGFNTPRQAESFNSLLLNIFLCSRCQWDLMLVYFEFAAQDGIFRECDCLLSHRDIPPRQIWHEISSGSRFPFRIPQAVVECW